MLNFREYAKQRDETVSEGLFGNMLNKQSANRTADMQKGMQNLQNMQTTNVKSPYVKAAPIVGKPNKELEDAEAQRLAYEKMKQGTGL